ncbi:MAG: hypothetical protein ACRDDY_03850 [Clostridium sp.]|uniref:hypothetical protein n=1 Tax=Clostridium sp. TaxID=1506 RepID=UPI003EE6C4CF
MIEILQAYKIDIIIVVTLIIGFFIFRKTPVVKSIVINALSEIEKRVNTDLAQKGIDEKVKAIRDDKKIPFLIRKCVTKYVLITIMEKGMNVVANVCEIDREFDLKGNDECLTSTSTKIELKDEVVEVSHKIEVGEKPTESDTYIYAEAKAKTDFKGESSGEIAIGIKKKI